MIDINNDKNPRTNYNPKIKMAENISYNTVLKLR